MQPVEICVRVISDAESDFDGGISSLHVIGLPE